jgi:PPOX class probable F420-dependent enzyme
MTDAEVRAFLGSDPPHTGKIAMTRKDGSPHVAPIWYAVDDGATQLELLFNTGADTLKGRILRRDPRVALCVDDERPPFSFVIVRGKVELIDALEQVRHWAAVIGGRYMGADQASAYGERNGVPGELLARLHVEHVVSEVDLAL